MKQEILSGIIFALVGLLLFAKPYFFWKITESWKVEKVSEPSSAALNVYRFIGAILIGMGFLLATGLLK